MPFLPEGGRCCQYRTFIFKSKNPEEVIFGHTPDCNIPQSLLDYGRAQFFAVYPNGPFEDSHPVMETTSNSPMLLRTPKWADDGKPIYWYVDLKEKNAKDLLHPSAAQKYEKAKKGNDAEKSDDTKQARTGDGEKTYDEKATQTDDKQQGAENQGQGDDENKKLHHTRVYNADSEDVTGSGPRPRGMRRGEDELRPQLQPLRICPYHGEDNCEVDDPEWYDRQQRSSEHDHLAMDSAATLARPPQSYDPRSPREGRHHVRSYLRPLNASNYCPPRVELHQENRDPNAGTAQHTRSLRGGALPTRADYISDDGETIVFDERDCRCVKYMVRGYGQPLEPVPTRYQVICERHDSNIQSRQARELWAEKDMKFMGLRGDASQANASQAKAVEEKHKREVLMEIEMMGGGYDAPVFAAVYENKPEQTSAPDAPTSPAKTTDNGSGQSTSVGLRGGGMNDANDGSEASADTWPTESTSLSELFDRAKEIKTRFENSGPKTGRPAPAEERNRLRVTSFIEALENPYGAAGTSTSSGCERCVNLSHKRLERWDDQELRKTIKEMQRETNRMDIRAAKNADMNGEIEDREEMLRAQERSFNEKKRFLNVAKDSFKRDLTNLGQSATELAGYLDKFSFASAAPISADLLKSAPEPVHASTQGPETKIRARLKSASGLSDGASRGDENLSFEDITAKDMLMPDSQATAMFSPGCKRPSAPEIQLSLKKQLAINYDLKEEGGRVQRRLLDFESLNQILRDREDDFKKRWRRSLVDANDLREQLQEVQGELEWYRAQYVANQRPTYQSQYSDPIHGQHTWMAQAAAAKQRWEQATRENYFRGMWRNAAPTGPSQIPIPPYYGYPSSPQNNMNDPPLFSAGPIRMNAMSFKPQSSEQLLANGGPGPDEYMSDRDRRQQDLPKDNQAQSAAFDSTDLDTYWKNKNEEAENQIAADKKKQEEEEEKKNGVQSHRS